MTPDQFGALALQLLAAAQIPGNALDQALQFREIAAALAEGRLVVTPPPKSQGGGNEQN